MPRPLNLFESRTILSYNKTPLVLAIRYNCVRAKELDDNRGSPQTGDYFNSMLELSNAIRLELGLAVAPLAIVEIEAKEFTGDILEADEYILLQEQFTTVSERSTEQETELEELDESIEAKDGEIKLLTEKVVALEEATALKIKELQASVKKLTAANKKLTKGAK